MDLLERLQFFGPLDVVAVLTLALSWLITGYCVENGFGARKSVSQLMVGYRHEWFRTLVHREPRILDGAILSTLRQGTTFFASACMISIGGGLALVGNTERIRGLAADLSLDADAPALIWEVKILLFLLFLANAFLKFVWSHRVFGYCAVIMAAVPNGTSEAAFARAAQAAELNITAARSYNSGLRAVYFGLSATAWLLGPYALICAALTTSAILARREFASNSRLVLLEGSPT